MEPLELGNLIGSTVVQPEVVRIAIVAVQSDDAESLPGDHCVITSLEDRFLGFLGQPPRPVVVQVLIQPLGAELIRNALGTEAGI